VVKCVRGGRLPSVRLLRKLTVILRAREKLEDRRHKLIEDLLKEDPNYKPPPGYKPRKFWKKIYIPVVCLLGGL
jgi:hypothetical protein